MGTRMRGVRQLVNYVVAGGDADDIGELAVSLGVTKKQINQVDGHQPKAVRRKRKMAQASRARNRR
jgi:hypothetical protein